MNKPDVYQITVNDSSEMKRARIAKAVIDVFQIAGEEMLLRPQDTGGVLLVGDTNFFTTVVDRQATFVGEFKRFTPEISFEVATEKFDRLFSHEGDISAWLTRDLDQKKYGGAIRARRIVLAFSGCSEHLDEALVTVAARVCKLINAREYARIIRLSKNPLTDKLYEAVKRRLERAA